MRRKTGSLGTSFIWKANRIKDLPTIVLHRHRRDPINDHPQRYHVNLGKRYVKGNVNPRSSEIHFKKRSKEVVIKGVDKPKENKTVYLTNGKDVAVVKSMSSDGKKLKVHIIGKEGYEYVNPKEWEILKISKGNLNESQYFTNDFYAKKYVLDQFGAVETQDGETYIGKDRKYRIDWDEAEYSIWDTSEENKLLGHPIVSIGWTSDELYRDLKNLQKKGEI